MKHTAIALALALAAPSGFEQERGHGGTAPDKLGTVHFETSCSSAVRPEFDRGVAWLHSFEFAPAIAAFDDVLKTDPGCGIAAWGIALARWSNPFAIVQRSPSQLQPGRDAVKQARTIGAKTDRERGYIQAVAKLYDDSDRTPQQARVLLYRDAMAALAAKYPDDTEATIFYALSITAAADPADKTYADQLKAGALLEALFAKQPDHPGLAHYIIHTYDVPPLAPRALDAARRYAKIAPSAPHALHMPSHTFTRVGSWQESIATNIASANAARRAGSYSEELHASDYKTYAYLQTAQDAAAKQVLDSLPEIVSRFAASPGGGAAPPTAGAFALAAIPARYALERGAWAEAARLEVHESPLPYADAMTWFARALGAAHTGDIPAIRGAIDALQRLQDREADAKETYWAGQIEIQKRGAAAWLALAEGRQDDALAEMRRAAEQEDHTEKSAVTPGPLAPARELLGQMLLQLNQPGAALEAFEATLAKEPNRFRAVAGAMTAASRGGNRPAARRYAAQLLRICERADSPGRPELAEARRLAAASL